jgi:hypothetical protein
MRHHYLTAPTERMLVTNSLLHTVDAELACNT